MSEFDYSMTTMCKSGMSRNEMVGVLQDELRLRDIVVNELVEKLSGDIKEHQHNHDDPVESELRRCQAQLIIVKVIDERNKEIHDDLWPVQMDIRQDGANAWAKLMDNIPKLTKMQRKKVCNGIPIDGFTVVDYCGVWIGPDNHGLNIYLAVIKQESDGQLYGVPWGSDSEHYTIGDYSDQCINEMLPIIPLWARTKTVTVYEGAGKSLLSELNLDFGST